MDTLATGGPNIAAGKMSLSDTFSDRLGTLALPGAVRYTAFKFFPTSPHYLDNIAKSGFYMENTNNVK